MAGHFLKNGMQKVGNYEVDTNNLLGRGGFGEVYYGVKKPDGAKVAAKRVWIKRAAGSTMTEVMQEVSTLQRIDHHENILRFFHSQREKDCLWIFTEYCEMGNLNSYYVTHKVELRHKIDIVHQSLMAIHHLHSQKPMPIVHRDIKPHNILITHIDGRIVIKMADFGLAKITSNYFGTAWAMRTLCGTEAFMAPEQFALQATGKGDYDWSVDIFALGLVTLSLMDTKSGYNLDAFEVKGRALGFVLWRLECEGQEVWSPVTFSLKEPRHVREVKTLVSIMMSHNPKLRPSALELITEMKKILDSIPNHLPLPLKLQIEDDFSAALGTWSDPEEPTIREIKADEDNAEFPRKRRSPKRTTIKRRLHPAQQKNKFKGPDIRGTLHIISNKTHTTPTQKSPKYVVIGGLTAQNSKVSNMCWQLDTTADGFLWQCLTEIPEEMCHFSPSICQVDHDSVVIMGGGNGVEFSNRGYQYQASKDSWKRLPNIPIGCCGASLVQRDEDLYLVGGEGKDNEILASCYRYSLRNRKWSEEPSMLQEMLLPITAATYSGIYVLFNTHPDNRAVQKTRDISMQFYDPDSKEWCYKAPMLSQIYDTLGASAVAVNQMIYVVGGWDKMCAQYNTLTDMWTLLRNSNSVHVYNSAVHFKRKITMFGGAGANGPITDIEEYDIDKNTWRVRTLELPEPLHFHYCAVLML